MNGLEYFPLAGRGSNLYSNGHILAPDVPDFTEICTGYLNLHLTTVNKTSIYCNRSHYFYYLLLEIKCRNE